MAKLPRDLADRTIDGTYPAELRALWHLALRAWEVQAEADEIEQEARRRSDAAWPELREIATMAYAVWRKIETICGPVVQDWESERDTRDTEEVEAKDAEEIAGQDDGLDELARLIRRAPGVFEQHERYD